jgi:hypothetical protein
MLLLSFERGASGIAQYTEFRRQYDEVAAVARSGSDATPTPWSGASWPASWSTWSA